MATKICGKDCLDTKPMYKNILCPEASYIFNKEVNACQKVIANFARDKHFEDDDDDRKWKFLFTTKMKKFIKTF